jgi:putative lipoic acid-binding regulatory protein
MMSDNSATGDFYIKLKRQLEETSNWPSEYLYKFIVKSDTDKVGLIEKLFDQTGAVINTKASKNGKYTSVSINLIMKSPDDVISKYIEVTDNVEGVIAL